MDLNKRYDGSEADIAGAALYNRLPGLLNATSEVLARLFSIARTYTLSQKYDVTQRAFASITHLVIEYLKLRRNNLAMPTSTQAMLFGPAQVSVDTVLTKQLEDFSAIYKLAASRNDEEICRQIVQSHRTIALTSIEIDPLDIHPGENPTTSYILGFLDSLTTEAGARGLDDACLAGCRALADVGAALIHWNFYLNFISAVDAIGRIATVGVLRSRQVLTSEAVSGICRMVLSSLSNDFMVRNTYRHSIQLLEAISKTQLQALGQARGIDFSVQNTLGPFLQVTSPAGLARWFEISANRVLDAVEKKDGHTERAVRVLDEIADGLWWHLANIGEAAAPYESFALFYVDMNVREIGKIEIITYHRLQKHLADMPEPQDRDSAAAKWRLEHFATELLRDLDWLVAAIYWRIYQALPNPVHSNLVWNFFDTLQELGITAMEAQLDKQAIRAIEHLSSLVAAMLEKPLESAYSCGRAAAYIARLGMVAFQRQDEAIVTSSLQALRKLHAQFLAKFADNQELATSLLSGVDEIAQDLDRGIPPFDEIPIHFARSTTPAAVTEYTTRMHQALNVG